MNEIQIEAGCAILSGNLTPPDTAVALVLFATAAGAAGIVRVINLSPAHSIVPISEGYFLTCSRLKKKRSTFILVNTDSTLICWPSALCTLLSGPGEQEETRDLRFGYFGSSIGGAAAFAAAELPQEVSAIARHRLRCEVKLEMIPGATHFFEEPGCTGASGQTGKRLVFTSLQGPR